MPPKIKVTKKDKKQIEQTKELYKLYVDRVRTQAFPPIVIHQGESDKVPYIPGTVHPAYRKLIDQKEHRTKLIITAIVFFIIGLIL